MPEMHFHVRWPDRTHSRCYSPSLVIKDQAHAEILVEAFEE
jgi:uncharacterized repeat protein (TIGR04042 family)